MSKRYIVVGVGTILVLGFLYYWFYLAKTNSLPAKAELMREMNEVITIGEVIEVQDVIKIDSKHLFVPFITKNQKYGYSVWQWKKHDWQFTSLDTSGSAVIWKVDPKVPSTYRFIWNYHPKDNIDHLKFYLIKERGYRVSYDVHFYQPGIQMSHPVYLEETSYGVLNLPKEWVSIYKEDLKLMLAEEPPLFNFMPPPTMMFGVREYDEEGNAVFPNLSVNGSGYSKGDANIDYLMSVNLSDLETVQ